MLVWHYLSYQSNDFRFGFVLLVSDLQFSQKLISFFVFLLIPHLLLVASWLLLFHLIGSLINLIFAVFQYRFRNLNAILFLILNIDCITCHILFLTIIILVLQNRLIIQYVCLNLTGFDYHFVHEYQSYFS